MSMTIEERAKSYLSAKTGLKFFAGLCKASGKTEILIYTEDVAKSLIDMHSNVYLYKEDGIRWAGRMVNKLDTHSEACRVTINTAWNKFSVGKNGFMSDAQENALLNALEDAFARWTVIGDKKREPERYEHNLKILRMLQSLKWQWTGHNHRKGVHDLYAEMPNGTPVWVEVKGINGRVFYS